MRIYGKVSIALLACLMLGSCTDSEQQAAIDRQKRIEQREQEDAQRRAAQQEQERQQQQEAQQQAPAEPETPPEPEKVDNYTLVAYGTWKSVGNVVCQCHERTECGMTFWGCNDNVVRACIHEVQYGVVKVTKTDDNNGDCGN